MTEDAAQDPWVGFLHRRRGSTEPLTEEIGAWVVSDEELPALDESWAGASLHVQVARGAGDVAPALTWASRSPASPRWLGLGLRDEFDTATNVRRVVAALDSARHDGLAPEGTDELALVLSPPAYASTGGGRAGDLPAALLRGLDEIAAAEVVLAVPCDAGLPFVAALLEAALDREVAMIADRCHGPRTDRTAIGWEQLLLGVRASLDGEPVARVLAEGGLAGVVDGTVVGRTRRWLRAAVLTG